MKNIFIWLMAICFPLASLAQYDIRLHIDSTFDMVTDNSMKIGIEYFVRGGIPKYKGSLFNKNLNPNRFYMQFSKNCAFNYTNDCIDIYNPQKTSLIINYSDPRHRKRILSDTIVYPTLIQMSFEDAPVNYTSVYYPELKVEYSDGRTRYYTGLKLLKFLTAYDCKVSVVNGEWEPLTGCITTKTFQNEIKDDFLGIYITGPSVNFKHIKNFDYSTPYSITFPAQNNPRNLNGLNGENISIVIKAFNDSLYTLELIPTHFKKQTFIINPKTSLVSIDVSGSNGQSGINGERGRNAPNKASGDYLASGQSGTNGTDGGNGGGGGNVTVFMPRRFVDYLSCLRITNTGGNGGIGGIGGTGGRNQLSEEDKAKLLYIFFPPRADYGNTGNEGFNGISGQINYIFTD